MGDPKEVIYGFLIAVAAGLGIGIALHLSGILRRSVYPILIASQSIPTVVLAPVLVLVMGFGIGPKLAIIALFCFSRSSSTRSTESARSTANTFE